MNDDRKMLEAQLYDADITQDDWWFAPIEGCKDLYARGYIEGVMEGLNGSMSYNTEEFREELLNVCTWDIWGKK